MNNNIKTIFLSIPYGMSTRNILRSEAFRILRERFRIVILSPLYKDGNFNKEFGGEQVIIKNLPKKFTILFKGYRYLLDIIEGYYFTRKTKIETLVILEQCLKQQKPVVYFYRKLIGVLLGSNSVLLKTLQQLQIVLAKNKYYEKLFNEFSPCFVFLTHSLALEEFPLAFYAKQDGTPLVTMIHSWDNITAKSGLRMVTSNKPGRMLPVKFDKVIVWNKIIQQELIDYYDYRPEDIFISSIPQFDFYFNSNIVSREKFFEKIGAKPEKKLILYAAGSLFILPKQEEIIGILIKAIKENKFIKPCQLLIRTHPGTNMDEWKERFCKNSNVLFDRASISNAAGRYSKGWQNSSDEQSHLAEILYHSDVTINVTSTLSLDAAVFDKPIICIGFDGHKNRPYYDSILKHYDFTHYKSIMQTGGIRLSKNPDELIEHINMYLENPTLDAEGRKRIREQQCYYLDGKAGERIANFICEFAKGL